jgi:hypothetical protein
LWASLLLSVLLVVVGIMEDPKHKEFANDDIQEIELDDKRIESSPTVYPVSSRRKFEAFAIWWDGISARHKAIIAIVVIAAATTIIISFAFLFSEFFPTDTSLLCISENVADNWKSPGNQSFSFQDMFSSTFTPKKFRAIWMDSGTGSIYMY